MPFYATYVGHIKSGVFTTWDECRREIHKKPKFKKFDTQEEAERFNKEGPFAAANLDFTVTAYTDGSCRKNGKAGAVGGYGVYFGPNDKRNMSHRLEGKVTNNMAELTAVVRAIEAVDPKECLGIYTDSVYSILCGTTYGKKCAKQGWPQTIPNKDLAERLYNLMQTRNVQLVHVPAHTDGVDAHSVGNRQADLLATQAAQ
jgi:ribonuclease HI